MFASFAIQRLVEGVYAAVATPGGPAWANAGIVDLGDRTLVFDTFATLQAATELRQAAEQLTGRPATLVVNSHEHMDHVHGNQLFPEAVIISTARTREVMAVRRPAFLETVRKHPEYPDHMAERAKQEQNRARRKEQLEIAEQFRTLVAERDRLGIKLPTVTFEDRLVIHGPARSVELLCYGGGHSPSDTFMYLPGERIAFMADLVHIQTHPAMRMGNPDQWTSILRRVNELDIETIVPGHGPIGAQEHVREMVNYIVLLQEQAQQLRASGADGKVVEQLPMPEQYKEWAAPSVLWGNLQFLLDRLAPKA